MLLLFVIVLMKNLSLFPCIKLQRSKYLICFNLEIQFSFFLSKRREIIHTKILLKPNGHFQYLENFKEYSSLDQFIKKELVRLKKYF